MDIHRSSVAVLAGLGFIVGIGIASLSVFAVDWRWIISCAVITFTIALYERGRTVIALVALIVCAVSVGCLRSLLLPTYHDDPVGLITAQGSLVRTPTIEVDHQVLVLRLAEADGLVRVEAPLAPVWRTGDQVLLTCELTIPQPSVNFAYDKYLRRYHIGRACDYPELQLIGHHQTARTRLDQATLWWMGRVQHALPNPEQGIVLGVLFGRDALPPLTAQQFQMTGTTHLLVISGWNVVLLTSVLLAVCRAFHLSPRWQAVLISIALGLYLLMTGVQPPAIRATLCGGLVLWLQLAGRSQAALRLLAWVAAIMLLINPLLLWYDAGFQLSMLATAGILLYQRQLERWLGWLPDVLSVRTVLAMTLAASISTAPLLAYTFHTLSLIAIPANLLLVPVFEVVMLSSLAWAVVALFSPWIAHLTGLLLYALLHGCLELVAWLAHLPHIYLTQVQFGRIALVSSYLVLIGLAWLWRDRSTHLFTSSPHL